MLHFNFGNKVTGYIKVCLKVDNLCKVTNGKFMFLVHNI